MVNEFYKKHKETIESAIRDKDIKFTIGEKETSNMTVHCYYVYKKNIAIQAYAKYNKTTKGITGYSATITIGSDTAHKTICNHNEIARHLYVTMAATHSEQIAKTCLRSNYDNKAFKKKR